MYVGLILNSFLFYRQALTSEAGDWLSIALAMCFSVVATYLFLNLFSWFGRWVLKILGGLLILISSLAAYFMWFFKVVIGYGIVLAVSNTELALSAESMDYRLLIFALVLGIVPIVFLLKMNIEATSEQWYQRLIWRVAFVVLAFVLLKGVDQAYKWNDNVSSDGQIAMNPFGIAAHSYVPSNWLLASMVAAGNHYVNQSLESKWIDPFKRFDIAESVDLSDTYLVFVVGESVRYDHMSLMGYERNTTPLLEKEANNIIGFKGESCNTATTLSLQCMFVREGGVVEMGNPASQKVKESHLFLALKKQGFSMDLFAMQSQVSFYSKTGADTYKIREEIGAEASQQGISVIDDFLLVDQTKQSLIKHPKGKHVIILHQKGSHFLYTNRYPRSFAQFTPECKGMGCNEAEMFNSYDNSILYTDYVLKSVIDLLRDKKALLVYASDHGESIGGDASHFHGTPKAIAPKEQFNIGIVMWASDSFLADKTLAKGFAAARAKQKKEETARHVELFESVLGCLGFTSTNGGIRQSNNWCGY